MFEQLQREIERREKDKSQKEVFAPQTEQHKQFYTLCKNIPFYLWDYPTDKHEQLAVKLNGRCCFNHLIGLPVKHGVKHQLYDYERKIYDELMKPGPTAADDIVTRQQHKHLAIVKATGLGISEYALRWIAWMCLRNDEMRGKRVVIITGNNIALATDLIRRLKALFLNPDASYPLIFESKETVLDLNGCTIQAFPSHHLSAARGLTDVAIIFLDEASFFEINQGDEARDLSERYIAKSDPYIILVSTPNKPGDLLHKITEQPEENCIYKRIHLDYTVGLGNIFTEKEIEIAKRSLSFEREYNLKFMGLVGNVFLDEKINEAIQLGKELDAYNQILKTPEMTPLNQFYIGVDSGFGSSAFAICLVTILDDKICILETIELYRQQFDDCIHKVSEVMLKYGLNTDNTKILVDASAPSVVSALKSQMGESTDYLSLLDYRKKNKLRDVYFDMTVIPVNFNTATKKEMLLNLKELLDAGLIVINLEGHANLVLALRTAQATAMILDKEATTSDDLLDAMSLACKRITVNRQQTQRFDFRIHMV